MTDSQHAVPRGERRLMTVVLAGLMALSPVSIDVYLPSLPEIAAELTTSLQLVESSISSYFLGLVPGLLLGAPISDRFGRRRTIFAGLSIYLVASGLIVWSQSIDQLLVLRCLQAVGAGVSTVNVGAVVRDVYEEQDIARMFSLIGMITMIAPLVGPGLGTLLLQFFEWRAIFVCLTLYAALLMIGIRVLLPETLHRPEEDFLRVGLMREVVANVRSVLAQRQALGFGLCTAFAFGTMLVFLSDASFAYIDYFGVSRSVFSLLFAANIVTMMAFNRLNVRLLKRVGPRSILPVGLTLQLIASLSLLFYVCLAEPRIAVVVPLVMLVVGPLGIIGANAMASYLAFFRTGTATANGIAGATQFTFGAFAGAALGAVHDGTLRTLGAGMAVCSLLAVVSLLALARDRRAS